MITADSFLSSLAFAWRGSRNAALLSGSLTPAAAQAGSRGKLSAQNHCCEVHLHKILDTSSAYKHYRRFCFRTQARKRKSRPRLPRSGRYVASRARCGGVTAPGGPSSIARLVMDNPCPTPPPPPPANTPSAASVPGTPSTSSTTSGRSDITLSHKNLHQLPRKNRTSSRPTALSGSARFHALTA